MALLQISEPSNTNTQTLFAAIDLGTTHSLISWFENGKAELLALNNNVIVPSALYFDADNNPHIGQIAIDKAKIDGFPNRVIRSFKRLFGQQFTDIDNNLFSNNLAEKEGHIVINTGFDYISPVLVASHIIGYLTKQLETQLKKNITNLVITVPAYFDDVQRGNVKQAASLVGFNAVQLLNEPTAAALAYGLQNKISGTSLIFDLGGGTFDVSVLFLEDGVFRVKAVGGDTQLGGDDIDLLVRDFILQKFDIKITNPEDQVKSILIAKNIKEELTTKTSHTTDFLQHKITITREEFNELSADFINKTLDICKKTLADADFTAQQLNQIVLVGGSSRLPIIQQKLQEVFGKTPLCSINPDQVVALGGAIHSNEISTQEQDLLLLDVTPLSLGIETMGGLMETIISRNTTIPITKQQEFTTYKNNQTAIIISVFQGERSEVIHNRSLGQVTLHGIPPMAAGLARVAIKFALDINGILKITATELTNNKNISIEINATSGVDNKLMAEMLAQSQTHFADDITKRMLVEAKLQAQQMLDTLNIILAEDCSDFANGDYLKDLADKINQLQLAINESDKTDHINKLANSLDEFAAEFMQQRMDKELKISLAGNAIKDY